MRPRVCSAALGLGAVHVLLLGCAGMFSATPGATHVDEAPPAVQALRVAVSPDVAIVAEGDVEVGFQSRLRSAVELQLGRAGLTVVQPEEAQDLVVHVEARVRGAVYFLHGHVTLRAEHAGLVVGTSSVGPDLHKEDDFAERMAGQAVGALVHAGGLVEFAAKRTPRAGGKTLLASTHTPPRPPPPAPRIDAVGAAKQHAKRGTTFYNLDRHAEALAEYELAYLAVPDAALLFNIAQCHRKLGHDKEALAFYKSYLRNAPRAPNRADVDKRIQELEDSRVATTPRGR